MAFSPLSASFQSIVAMPALVKRDRSFLTDRSLLTDRSFLNVINYRFSCSINLYFKNPLLFIVNKCLVCRLTHTILYSVHYGCRQGRTLPLPTSTHSAGKTRCRKSGRKYRSSRTQEESIARKCCLTHRSVQSFHI